MFLDNITWHFLEWSCGQTFVTSWIIGDSSICCRNVLTCFKDVTRVHRQKVKPHFFNAFLNVITLHPPVSFFFGGGGGSTQQPPTFLVCSCTWETEGCEGRVPSDRRPPGLQVVTFLSNRYGAGGGGFPPAAKFINAHKGVHPGGRLCRRSAGIWVFFFLPADVRWSLLQDHAWKYGALRWRRRSTRRSTRSES